MSGACSSPPFSLAARTAIAPAAPVAHRLVPSSGSTAMSTSGKSAFGACVANPTFSPMRSEEHTSELQSHLNLVCRLLLEKKKKRTQRDYHHNGTHTTRTH